MYFKKVEIDNIGPISKLNIEFGKTGELPKPTVIVGENGTGKSILLSHIVNALISGKQIFYDDTETEQGKVYKLRSPSYIRSGSYYSRGLVEADSGENVLEWHLQMARSIFEEQLKFTPTQKDWSQIPNDQHSLFATTFKENSDNSKLLFKSQCNLYFPPNRFEEPAWLNSDNLNREASYSERKRISRRSDRDIICTAPLKNNLNWLLDVFLDRSISEIKTTNIPLPVQDGNNINIPMFQGFDGQNQKLITAVLNVLKAIIRKDGNIRLGFGTRHNRIVNVVKDDKAIVPNLFNLSTGEHQLINMFLSIIRDYDLSEGTYGEQSEIKGVVVVDEIDTNLHTSHQREILPELIKSFPKVQFIVTTHAPLFLVGMTEKFGEDGFDVINMPSGEKISPNDFTEFAAAYDALKETTQHRETMQKAIEESQKPVAYVEGDYDMEYLIKAAELLNQKAIIESIRLEEGGGYGGLDKIWKACNSPASDVLPSKIVVLYDCDTQKDEANRGQAYKRIIPTIENNPIEKGIENLFSHNTIQKVRSANEQFFIVHEAHTSINGGEYIQIPERIEIVKSQKKNLCEWLCENGELADFQNFNVVFDLIESTVLL